MIYYLDDSYCQKNRLVFDLFHIPLVLSYPEKLSYVMVCS